MCGIAGIIAYGRTAPAVDRRELDRIRDHMAARGPDGKATWLDAEGRIGLAHRRLAIIDLSEAGAQPMASADGRLVITFNGEIYNHEALRRGLEAKGRVFRSRSDTEVLLHLYAEKGAAMVHDLRGMFAFGLWDAEKRGLLLARDPFGIKPLYWADDGATLRFASQVKALPAGGAVRHEIDIAGLTGFYLLGAVPEPFTIDRHVRSLPRGSTMWVDAAGVREASRYFSPAAVWAEAERSSRVLDDAALGEHVRAALLDSVRHHLVADVPVGAFLSAGVDSGSLVGLMRDAGQSEIETVTLAFEEFRGKPEDEAPLAEVLARRYGTRHTTRWVGEREFAEDLPRIVAAMDQPSVDGINTWFVSKAARERGLKVAVSGLGGDELLGGYSSFRNIPLILRMMSIPARVPLLGVAVRRAMAGLAGRMPGIKSKLPGLVEYGGDYPAAYLLRRSLFMPWELEAVMGRDEAREGLERLGPRTLVEGALDPEPATAFGKVASLESSIYMGNQLLRDTDWASMAHSLEVRVPLVDAELVRRLAPVLVAKRQLDGKALLGAAPSLPLADEIIRRPKTGFSLPYEQWLHRGTGVSGGTGTGSRPTPWTRRWACQLAKAAQ